MQSIGKPQGSRVGDGPFTAFRGRTERRRSRGPRQAHRPMLGGPTAATRWEAASARGPRPPRRAACPAAARPGRPRGRRPLHGRRRRQPAVLGGPSGARPALRVRRRRPGRGTDVALHAVALQHSAAGADQARGAGRGRHHLDVHRHASAALPRGAERPPRLGMARGRGVHREAVRAQVVVVLARRLVAAASHGRVQGAAAGRREGRGGLRRGLATRAPRPARTLR